MLCKIAALFISFSVLFGCGQNPADLLKKAVKGKETDKIRIGVSFPAQYETRWNKDLEYIEMAAKEAGAELFYEVSDKDVSEQAMQCDEILQKDISVLP